jgi:hypothetical protein
VNSLDFTAINAALDPETVVPRWLPNGKRRNKEWVAANPTRADNNPGSFSINLETGVWKDFAGGSDDWGKDLVSLYAYLFHNSDQGAAARELAQDNGIQTNDPVVRERAMAERAAKVASIEAAKPKLILPVPQDAPPPDFKHFKFGEPAATWCYRNAKGEPLLYVCRFDPPGERKQVIPRSWCDHPGKGPRWTWSGITGKSKRPLYGLDKLAANPDADAVLVEGEKAADAGQELFGDSAVVVTWMGGVPTADRAELRQLAGRRVILWPDFDAQRVELTKEEQAAGVDPFSKPLLPLHEQPGMRAMMAHAQALKGVAREVVMVGYTIDPDNHGWDLGDAKAEGWDLQRVMAYMGANAGDPWHVASGKPAAPAAPPATPPANDNEPLVPLDASVNPFGFPHLSDKGQPMNTMENLAYLLGQYGIRPRYNVISKDVEITIPGMKFSRDNHDAVCKATISSLCSRNRMPKADAMEYTLAIADADQYNPAADWIDAKPWDGVDRIVQLSATLDPVDPKLAEVLLRRWMIGAIGCVFNDDGMSMQGVLVLQGAQYTGKTTWFWALTNWNKKLGKEGVSLNPNDRDSVKGAISHWIVELGELDATFRKADVAALKSFITKDTDEIFLRYARAISTFARRTAYFGTVNPLQFQHDDTGNRRYWTIRCGDNLNAMHGIDMQQAWAQAKTLWAAGEQHRLTREEMDALNEANLDHAESNPIEELILTKFQWGGDTPRTNAMTATDVLLAIGYDKPNKAQAKEAGTILRRLTGAEPRKSNGKSVFDMPPRARGAGAGPMDDTDTRPF